MSTSRDVLKFSAAAAAAGMAATEFECESGTVPLPLGPSSLFAPERVALPEVFDATVTLTIDGRRQDVQPLSFFATLPAPYDAEIFVWGYHVRPAVLGANDLAVSADAPTGDPAAACGGSRLSLTPILRQCITVDEGIYRTLPRHRFVPAIDPVTGRVIGDRVRTTPQPMVRLADPIPGAAAGGMTPDMARQMVLVEVERFAGLVQPILVNNTRWDGVEERGSSPTEIWESCNLMEAAEHLHFVEFQFVGRHGLDADAFRALYDSLFPGAPYPDAIGDTEVVAARGVETRSTAHASGLGPGWPADERYVLASPRPFGNIDAGGLRQGPLAQPAPGGAGWADGFAHADDTVPAGLFGLEPEDGPGYVWHCHIVCRGAFE